MISVRSALLTIVLSALLGAGARAAQDVPPAVEARASQKGHKMTWSLPADSGSFGIEDLYKLLHQAYLGPGHAIPSREEAAAYLHDEWASLSGPLDGEPLLEVLAEGAPFVRLHMRPYRAQGGTEDSLLVAFLRSAATPVDSISFRRAWGLARARIEGGEIHLSLAAYDAADAELRPLGFPAIHHSPAYQRRFQPAYRVIGLPEAGQLLAWLASRTNQ